MFGLPWVGWMDVIRPEILVPLSAILVWYLIRTSSRRAEEPVPPIKKAYFVTGIILLYFSVAGPVGVFSHILFSVHMTSMALAYMVSAPLILLGSPDWLARRFFRFSLVRKFASLLLHPLVSLFLFNVAFSLYHIPAVHEAVMGHMALHTGYFFFLFVLAMVMWMQIASPLPEYNRLSELRKIAYIFANGVLMTPACAVIIFADTPLYESFSHFGHMAHHMGMSPDHPVLKLLDPLNDQRLGGILMKTTQEFVYGFALACVFFQWYRKEQNQETPNEGITDGKGQMQPKRA